MQELDIGGADEGMLQSTLTEGERSAAGRLHPWLMGGEYPNGTIAFVNGKIHKCASKAY